MEFKFSTDLRIKKSKMAEEGCKEKLQSVAKVSIPLKVTVPIAPVFQSDKRCQLRKEREQERKDLMAAHEVTLSEITEFDAKFVSFCYSYKFIVQQFNQKFTTSKIVP